MKLKMIINKMFKNIKCLRIRNKMIQKFEMIDVKLEIKSHFFDIFLL
jgi:hypothetical protein